VERRADGAFEFTTCLAANLILVFARTPMRFRQRRRDLFGKEAVDQSSEST
jgi:hypothetical protein